MGKITVLGKAERLCDANCMELFLEVAAQGTTVAEASGKMGQEVEVLLEQLEKLGITAADLRMERDAIEELPIYREGAQKEYNSVRSISFRAKPDMKVVNAIRSMIEKELQSTRFHVQYSLANEKEIKQELLKEAVADSRAQAELLATSMGQKIVGIEEAQLTGDRFMYESNVTEEAMGASYDGTLMLAKSRSDELQPKENLVTSEVRIVWCVE